MKTAVVTGASSGIGRAVARTLLTREFHVIGTSRNISAIADPLPGVEYRELDLTESEIHTVFRQRPPAHRHRRVGQQCGRKPMRPNRRAAH
ncbi:SDR family NAD(P)-dependent oxidoreductase [Rhodococcus sp. 2.95]